MSLSEQFATTPRPRESRLLAAAADLLRAAGWRVEAPAPEPPARAVVSGTFTTTVQLSGPEWDALISDTAARQDRYVAQWLQRPEFVAALRRQGAELVPDSGGNWRLQWRPDAAGEALPCDCEMPEPSP